MNTPENIKTLEPNQIFVFGSNLNGYHAGGAARTAKQKFGAIEGIGEGLAGQSYAFPTLYNNMEKLSDSDILISAYRLYKCAIENPDKDFLVTKVGCGIAGYKIEEIKRVFEEVKLKNIILPIEFI